MQPPGSIHSSALYDRHNDRFLRTVVCPYPGCGAPCPLAPERSPEVCLCPRCLRPYELVALSGELGGADPWTARRPHAAYCTRSGRRLDVPTLLDWAESGGGPGRAHAMRDPSAHLFGAPSRDVEWTLEPTWTQARWGQLDRARPNEQITSLSVHRGVVVAASARGRVGLFRPDDGEPLLNHPLDWPGAETDESLRQTAVRQPAALRSEALCLITERRALFRDLSSSLFYASTRPGAEMSRATPRGVFIGPPLVVELGPKGRESGFALLDGEPQGASLPPKNSQVVLYALDGSERARIDAEGLVRPPVFEPERGLLLWVNQLGHVFAAPTRSVEAGAGEEPDERQVVTIENVDQHLPSTMLELRPTERPLLVVSPNNASQPELWLADDKGARVRVWRAPLERVLAGEDWSWEPVFEDDDLGALRGLAVGVGSGAEANRAGLVFALTTDRAAAIYSRAIKTRDAEAVLAREAIAPPVLTHVGMLMQDSQGLWLRGLAPWAFKDDNYERLLTPSVPPVRTGFFDQTLAVLGLQVFFAVGGTVCAARLRKTARGRSS